MPHCWFYSIHIHTYAYMAIISGTSSALHFSIHSTCATSVMTSCLVVAPSEDDDSDDDNTSEYLCNIECKICSKIFPCDNRA